MNAMFTQAPSHSLDLLKSEYRIENRDRAPNEFIETVFTDPHGKPLQRAQVHRDLQEFLSQQPKALIELPRDHGKSTQICARVIWELAHDPS
jgi:hypothetical protein